MSSEGRLGGFTSSRRYDEWKGSLEYFLPKVTIPPFRKYAESVFAFTSESRLLVIHVTFRRDSLRVTVLRWVVVWIASDGEPIHSEEAFELFRQK